MRAASLARPLAAMGFDVSLIASRAQIGFGRIETDWHGVHVIQMPDLLPWRIRNAGLSPLDLLSRLAEVRGRPYDLMHIFDHRPAASFPVLIRLIQDIPLVSDWADLWGHEGFSEHRHEFANAFLSLIDNRLEPYVHTHCRALTVISEDLRQRALQLGVAPDCIHTVSVGANSDLVRPMDKRQARAKFDIPPQIPVLAYCGFSALDMGLLADSFSELVQLIPNVLLIRTGARVRPFETFVEQRGLSRQVRHFGAVPYEELGEILSCGDVMLLPYQEMSVNRARFPNRFGDYLAAGRPIATNRVGDHAAVVEQEGIGVVTAPNPRAFAEGIASLLEQPDQLAGMGTRARELAVTRFSWKRIAEPIAELYTELLR